MSVETVVLNGLGLIPAEMVSEICAGIEVCTLAQPAQTAATSSAKLNGVLSL
jgi:hypothetical protein